MITIYFGRLLDSFVRVHELGFNVGPSEGQLARAQCFAVDQKSAASMKVFCLLRRPEQPRLDFTESLTTSSTRPKAPQLS